MIHHAKYECEFIPDDHYFMKYRQEKKDSCFAGLKIEEKPNKRNKIYKKKVVVVSSPILKKEEDESPVINTVAALPTDATTTYDNIFIIPSLNVVADIPNNNNNNND